jgi:hypothetical protein
MASRRLQKRIEAEAAEKLGSSGKKNKATTKKRTTKAAKPTARKRKVKEAERKKIYWGVFSGTLKEEGRYAYDERDKAEEKLAQLRSRSKKLFFIQPIKESLSEAAPAPEEAVPADENGASADAAAASEDEEELEDDSEEE